jgi:hypothetical protein
MRLRSKSQKNFNFLSPTDRLRPTDKKLYPLALIYPLGRPKACGFQLVWKSAERSQTITK